MNNGSLKDEAQGSTRFVRMMNRGADAGVDPRTALVVERDSDDAKLFTIARELLTTAQPIARTSAVLEAIDLDESEAQWLRDQIDRMLRR